MWHEASDHTSDNTSNHAKAMFFFMQPASWWGIRVKRSHKQPHKRPHKIILISCNRLLDVTCAPSDHKKKHSYFIQPSTRWNTRDKQPHINRKLYQNGVNKSQITTTGCSNLDGSFADFHVFMLYCTITATTTQRWSSNIMCGSLARAPHRSPRPIAHNNRQEVLE